MFLKLSVSVAALLLLRVLPVVGGLKSDMLETVRDDIPLVRRVVSPVGGIDNIHDKSPHSALPVRKAVRKDRKAVDVGGDFNEHQVARRAKTVPLQNVSDYIATISGEAFNAPFKRCALVGSSKDLLRNRYGAQIDGHDTVIRVGRLPYAQDMDTKDRIGYRTDVWFTTWCNLIKGRARIKFFGDKPYSKFTCSLTHPERNTSCPDIRSIVVRSRRGGFCNKNADEFQKSGAIGEETDVISGAVQALRFGKYAGKSSTGMHAFVTFGSICDSLTLYGFSGTATIDDHLVTYDHHLGAEHELLAKIAQGMPASSYPPELRNTLAVHARNGDINIM